MSQGNQEHIQAALNFLKGDRTVMVGANALEQLDASFDSQQLLAIAQAATGTGNPNARPKLVDVICAGMAKSKKPGEKVEAEVVLHLAANLGKFDSDGKRRLTGQFQEVLKAGYPDKGVKSRHLVNSLARALMESNVGDYGLIESLNDCLRIILTGNRMGRTLDDRGAAQYTTARNIVLGNRDASFPEVSDFFAKLYKRVTDADVKTAAKHWMDLSTKQERFGPDLSPPYPHRGGQRGHRRGNY